MMRVFNHGLLVMAGAAVVFPALAADPAISVTAQQRYPWNGLVDIDFTITGDLGSVYPVDFCAVDKISGTNIQITTLSSKTGKKMTLGMMLAPGEYRWIWDAATDIEDDFMSDRVMIVGAVNERTWMVLSLDSGDVLYRAFKPTNGWDAYGSKSVILRKINADTFYMGSATTETGRQENEDYHKVTISKPYYISIKPISISQQQCILGQSVNNLNAVELSYLDLRGDDVVSAVSQSYKSRTLTITQNKTATGYSWPTSTNVHPNSLIGRLRSKIGKMFDLPTEAQWEYVRENDEKYGIEGMRESAGEWCLDAYGEHLGMNDVVDPKGPSTTYVLKGDLLGEWAPAGNGSKHCLYFNGTQYKFEGTEGQTIYHYAYYNAYGVNRVIKGGSRKAYRTFAYNLNTNGVIFSEGVMMKNFHTGYVITRRKASYVNPTYSFRIVVEEE